MKNEENVLFFTDFHFPLTAEFRQMLSPFGFESKFESEMISIFETPENARHAVIAGQTLTRTHSTVLSIQ